MSSRVWNARSAFGILLAAFVVYAGVFIYRTSFVVRGERYFSLFDDAMISMRYARNLAHGYGLVWNPGGEHVEGYTNFLWVLGMAVVHVFPLAISKTSLVVQGGSALLIAVNTVLVWKLAARLCNGSTVARFAAAAMSCFY